MLTMAARAEGETRTGEALPPSSPADRAAIVEELRVIEPALPAYARDRPERSS